jgi:hypothetical protein
VVPTIVSCVLLMLYIIYGIINKCYSGTYTVYNNFQRFLICVTEFEKDSFS